MVFLRQSAQESSVSDRVPPQQIFLSSFFLVFSPHHTHAQGHPQCSRKSLCAAGLESSDQHIWKPQTDNYTAVVASDISSPLFFFPCPCQEKNPNVIEAIKNLLLHDCAEHYLGTRKAQEEQTFTTECASAKTKIPSELLVLAR